MRIEVYGKFWKSTAWAPERSRPRSAAIHAEGRILRSTPSRRPVRVPDRLACRPVIPARSSVSVPLGDLPALQP